PVNPGARLGFLCSGTAEDVARNLGLPTSLRRQLDIAAGTGKRPVDVGKVVYRNSDGSPAERLFLNDCQPGIAAKVVQRVTPGLKRLGGFLAFGIGATLTAMVHRAHTMTVTIDDQPPVTGKFLGVVVANGRFAGGGMDFAPSSRIDDGVLDIVIIRDQIVPLRLLNFPKIYSGGHVDLSWITYRKGKSVGITSPDRVPIEADGELLGFLPCSVTLLPGALAVAS
ncbi:MAG: hypothetical protein WD295_04220, partial [Bacteroidota bacterium]